MKSNFYNCSYEIGPHSYKIVNRNNHFHLENEKKIEDCELCMVMKRDKCNCRQNWVRDNMLKALSDYPFERVMLLSIRFVIIGSAA